MYMVSDGKIYSLVYSIPFKMYPELKVYKNPKGGYILKPTGAGVATKPLERQVATLEEVLAQFGSVAVEEVKPKATKK